MPLDSDSHSSVSDESHDGEHGSGGHDHPPELENIWNLLARSPLNKEGALTHPVIRQFDPYVHDPTQASLNFLKQNVFFSFVAVLILWIVIWRAMRHRAIIPGRAQSAIEILIESMGNFFIGILGQKHGPRYVPFLLALFYFILANNLMGLVPLMKAPTNAFQVNLALALSVFFYVQYTGLRYNGPKKYFLHLLGNPKGPVMWALAPLFFFLEVFGELIKPISLALRLFGNVLGEDILLGVFAMLGIALTATFLRPVGIEYPIVGLPLHLPFMFLVLLTSTIQALIFSLLASIYILLMLPHDEDAH